MIYVIIATVKLLYCIANDLKMVLWTEKYKPKSIEDYIGNDDIKRIVLELDINMPHILAIGPRGCGKKTLMKLLAKKILGGEYSNNFLYVDLSRFPSNIWFKSKSDWSYNEQNVAERNNVVSVKDFAFSLPINAPFKIVMIDEVQKLDFLSQQALRVIIEKSSAMTRFILIGTSIGNIIDPIISRTAMLRFKALSFEEFKRILEKVLKAEKVNYDNKIIPFLFTKLNANVFRAITILNSLDDYTLESVKKALEEKVNMRILFYHIEKKDFVKIRDSIRYLFFNLNLTSEEIILEALNYVESSNYDVNKKIELIKRISEYEPKVYKAYEPYIELENLFINLVN